MNPLKRPWPSRRISDNIPDIQRELDLNNLLRSTSIYRAGDWLTETGPATEGAGRARVRK